MLRILRKQVSSPPGPSGHRLWGNIEVIPDPLAFMRKTAQDFGGVASVRLLTHRAWHLTDADAIESVLIHQAANFRKHKAVRILPVALGDGLLTSEGDFYARQRRLVQPAFQRSQVNQYVGTFISQTKEMLDRWQPGQQYDILQEMYSLTLNTASKTLFGAGSADHSVRVRQALELGQAEFVRRFTSLIRLPLWIPTPGNLRLRRAVRELDEIIFDFIQEHRASSSEGCDLMARLMSARDSMAANGMTDKQLRDECLTIFLAGQETSALAMSWCWILLSQHPEEAELVYEEVDRVLGSDVPTIDHVAAFERIEHVLLETMRLFPPIYVIGREAIVDTTIADYPCPRGTNVLIPIWGIHRNERYFDAPDEFRPSRWQGDFSKTLPKGVYLPFSTGPRTCVGANFAMTQMKLVIAMIAQRFQFQVMPDRAVYPFPQVTLAPSPGVPTVLESRCPVSRGGKAVKPIQATSGCPMHGGRV